MADGNGFTHAIVNFTGDNSVEVVPASWVLPDEKGTYFPPPGTKKLKKIIKEGTIQNSEWTMYECKVFKWFGSYDEARAKLSDAMVTSDLSSNEITARRSKKIESVPALPPHPSSSITTPFMTTTNDNAAFGENSNTAELNLETTPSGYAVETVILDPTSFVTQDDCDSEFKTEVLSKLEAISIALQEQGSMLATIMSQLSTKGTDCENEIKFDFEPNTFPVKNIQQLRDLEELLRNVQAKLRLVRILKGCGGSTVEDALHLMISKIMSDEVAASHSSKGKSGKLSFGDYANICESVIGGLNGNPRTCTNATTAELNIALPKVLKKAADRVRLRKKTQRLQTIAGSNREEEEDARNLPN